MGTPRACMASESKVLAQDGPKGGASIAATGDRAWVRSLSAGCRSGSHREAMTSPSRMARPSPRLRNESCRTGGRRRRSRAARNQGRPGITGERWPRLTGEARASGSSCSWRARESLFSWMRVGAATGVGLCAERGKGAGSRAKVLLERDLGGACRGCHVYLGFGCK